MLKKFGLLILSSLILAGCATTKIVEKWPEHPAPPWVKGAPPPGYFKGMAINASNEKEGWYVALQDVKKQICNAMGLETREMYEKRVVAYNEQVDKRVIANFKQISAALLEDIDSSIEDAYLEKWMGKTRYRKIYFYNYYVLVRYPQSKINEMKRKTAQENEKRLRGLEKCLSFAKEEEIKGDFVKALRTYVYALFIAETLFRNSEIRALECTYKVAGLVASLRLVRMGNYVEEHASTHKVVVKASVNDVPAVNVPVKFEITSGKGRVDPLVFTNRDGLASARVNMSSIQENNRIKAFVDFGDVLSIDERLRSLNEVKEVNFTFSTLGKIANVQGGTLYIDKKKESWLKKIPVLKFDLREMNGVSAAFDRYDIEMKGLFECKHWLTGRVRSWTRSEVGNFNLNEKIAIEAKAKARVVFKCNAWLINMFKSMSKEKHSKKIQLILTLYGKDNNGNPCEVTMESTPIVENPF